MKTTNLLVSSKTNSTDDTQDYLSPVANSNLSVSIPSQHRANLSTSQAYSDYSNPIWLATSSTSNSSSTLPALSLASTTPTPTLVGTAGGLQINLVWGSNVSGAPATFQAGIIKAAQMLCDALSNKVVLNINISYTGTGGGAGAGPTNGTYLPYSTVVANLKSHAASGDTTFNGLPTGTTIQGQSQVLVFEAQLKLWGLAPMSASDGQAIFATDINPSLLPGVALHELTHAMGRVPFGPSPDIFDLFRYTPQGTLLFSGSIPAAASYFSLDGGKTKLADYGRNSDPSDFLNTGIQGNSDPLNEFYNSSTTQTLSQIDLKQFAALGFTLKTTTTSTPIPSTGSIATFISNLASLSSSSFAITDTSANIALNLDALQTNNIKISSITQSGTATALAITASQLTADATALNKISGTYTLTVSGVTGAAVASTAANTHVSSMTVTDTGANIASNLDTLQNNIAKITSITQSNIGSALAITALQSLADNALLSKISGTISLNVTGTSAADSLFDKANSQATLTGGAGIDTFNISGIDTITDLGNGGADIVKIALGGSSVSTLAASWIATASTSNAATTASAATINTNGFDVNIGAAAGTSGWTINATGNGTTSITGSIKNDTINGNTSGGLTINGGGGSDSIALGTHTNADTIYLVNNNKVTITGFGSSTGSVTDILNVTATGNALAGLTLQNKTTLATNNAPLAANSTGLVFNYANAGTALTAASAAALFSNTQATNKFAIATGSGIELLIETGASAASTSNHVWKIVDTAGVFSAIELTGVTVAAGHNITFSNFH